MKKKIAYSLVLMCVSSSVLAENKPQISVGLVADMQSTKKTTFGESAKSGNSLYKGLELKIELDRIYVGYQQTSGTTKYDDSVYAYSGGVPSIKATDEQTVKTTTIYAGYYFTPTISAYYLQRSNKHDRTLSNAHLISDGSSVTVSNPSSDFEYKGKGFGILGKIPSSDQQEFFYDVSKSDIDNTKTDQGYKETELRGGINFLTPGSKVDYSVSLKYRKRDYNLFDISTTTTGIGGEIRYVF